MNNLTLLLDIGTTTITGALLGQNSSRALVVDTILNGQVKFGDDIVSRIDLALKAHANEKELQKASTDSINTLLKKMLASVRRRNSDIEQAFCVCNTGIHHLLLGINTSSLVTPPYKAAHTAEVRVQAGSLGFNLKKDCPVVFLPNIGGFVGSDALSVIIATGIYNSSGIRLAIDIGTNGEVILGNKSVIFVASTAAGPAFEGRHIRCGMPAVLGAIESVSIKRSKPVLKVIGDIAPKGICGSGLIDALSEMLKASAMNNSGKMDRPEYILYKKKRSKIYITQNDVRQIQLAKTAIYAAVKILMRKSNIDNGAIKEIVVTGSFGNRLNPQSLINIGLIPVTGSKIRFLKQGALVGLINYLIQPSLQNELTSILSKIRHIPLFGKGFNEVFTSSMSMGAE